MNNKLNDYLKLKDQRRELLKSGDRERANELLEPMREIFLGLSDNERQATYIY